MPVITIGITAEIVSELNLDRDKIYLQNVGTKPIYFTKYTRSTTRVPTTSDFDFVLYPSNYEEDTSEAEHNDHEGITFIDIQTIGGVKAIAGSAGAKLAYFQTTNGGVIC